MGTQKPFRLVIFDWDGTVMDSGQTILACMRSSFADVDYTYPGDDMVRGGIGLGLDQMLVYLAPEAPKALHRKIIARYRHHWLSNQKDEHQPFEGAEETIVALSEQGYQLAVATGKSRAGLDRELARTGLDRYFLTTRTVNESPSKPNPQMLLDVLEDLGARPQNALMVGDSTYDLEMAHHAKVASVGVLCGSHSRAKLEHWGPLQCLPDISGLPSWLERRSSNLPHVSCGTIALIS